MDTTETKPKKKKVFWTSEEWGLVLTEAGKLKLADEHKLSDDAILIRACLNVLPPDRARYQIAMTPDLTRKLNGCVLALQRREVMDEQDKAYFDRICANEGLYVAFLRTDNYFYADSTTPFPADQRPPHHVVPAQVNPSTVMDDDELFLAASYHPKRQELLTHLVVDSLDGREKAAIEAGGAEGWKATQSISAELKTNNINPDELHAMILWLALRRGMQSTDKAVMIVGLRKHQQEQVEKAFGDKTALHRAVLFASAPNSGLIDPGALPTPPPSCKWVIMFAGAPSPWFKEILAFRKDVTIDHYRHIEEIIKAIREMLQSDKYAVKQSSAMIDNLMTKE